MPGLMAAVDPVDASPSRNIALAVGLASGSDADLVAIDPWHTYRHERMRSVPSEQLAETGRRYRA